MGFLTEPKPRWSPSPPPSRSRSRSPSLSPPPSTPWLSAPQTTTTTSTSSFTALRFLRQPRTLSPRTTLLAAGVLCMLWLLSLVVWDEIATVVPERASEVLAHHPFFLGHTEETVSFPVVVPGLLMAPWPGNFRAPVLEPPTEGATGPALLSLHVFSMPTVKSRARRLLIRQLHPLRAVPTGYKHLVDFKFIMGQTRDEEGWLTQEELDREQTQFGDIVQLKGLKNDENMNEGKSLDWLQWVARSGRKAQWVWKCDDDTFVLMPNLLAELLRHDPSLPTYIGSSLGRGLKFNIHFLGMAYGFSWPVVESFGAANISRHVIEATANEDVRMGDMMLSLPSKPSLPPLKEAYPCLSTDTCTEEELTNVIAPDIYGWTRTPSARIDYPRGPDPRTGLHYVNLLNKLVQIKFWPKIIGLGTRSVIAWHGVKRDEDYLTAYHEAQQGFKSRSRPYEWHVPSYMSELYDPSEEA